MEQLAQIPDVVNIVNPNYLNLEYWFYKILEIIRVIIYMEFPFGENLWGFIQILLSILAILLFIEIAWLLVRIKELKQNPEIFFTKESASDIVEESDNNRWQKVLELVNSPMDANWRLAVLEADNMLDDMLKLKKYEGETLGERLQNSNPDLFTTIDYAWEAHKIRNQIAHEGTNFNLTHHDALRTVSLFERVFREFD